jgi:hypothetical protein
MAYRLAADLTLVLHLSFIVFVLFGGLLSLRHPHWACLHLPALTWGIWVEWSKGLCPLTPLENHFRQLAALEGYRESFVEHYLVRLIYPGQLTVSTQWLLGMFALSVNLIVYFWVFRKRRKYRNRVDE